MLVSSYFHGVCLSLSVRLAIHRPNTNWTVTSANKLFLPWFVCLSVCLFVSSVTQRFRRGTPWDKKQLVRLLGCDLYACVWTCMSCELFVVTHGHFLLRLTLVAGLDSLSAF